ncbi:DUF4344 domain-containing metallopeptidase [Hoeflea sp.]|uniref:DUF4344 domain-containing metallopeptidase n=1 Tax=Hoeflea sp. TaxID=1940281 RepID=UPI003B02D0A2
MRGPSVACAFFLLSAVTGEAGEHPTSELEHQYQLSDFVKNVTTHVLLHEVGHAIIREFELPVLGNEESMADSFATNYISQHMRENAPTIIMDRARSWMFEDSEKTPSEYDLKGEHDLDIRRAYRSLCLLYGADPAEWPVVAEWAGFSEHDANECTDIAPQQIASWDKVLEAISLDGPFLSNNVDMVLGDSFLTPAVASSGILDRIGGIMRGFKWPSQVTLHFDSCDAGASWNRFKRRILICDSYVSRFVQQEKFVKRLPRM